VLLRRALPCSLCESNVGGSDAFGRERRGRMTTRGLIAAGAFAWLLALPAAVLAAPLIESLTIGDTFTLPSKVLDETRRINVFTPTVYGDTIDAPLPVIYMPDGGIHEDFLHIAGLVQVSVS